MDNSWIDDYLRLQIKQNRFDAGVAIVWSHVYFALAIFHLVWWQIPLYIVIGTLQIYLAYVQYKRAKAKAQKIECLEHYHS